MKMIPTPRILLSERNKDWSITGAISELIDNSLGADRGDADEVHVHWNPKNRVVKVLDNGRGMRQMSYLFRLGQGEQGSNLDIGKYGQGGSSALLWLADQVVVVTVRDGQRSYTKQNIHQVVDVDGDWLDVSDEWTPATVNNVPTPLNQHRSGTLIALTLRDNKKMYADVVRRELSKTYAAGLRKGRRIVWFTEGEDPIELTAFNPGDLINVDEFHIEVEGMGATVKAGIGERITQRDAGVSVTFGHRQIIKTREPLNGWDGGKLFGWVDLSPAWHDYLTNNKTAIADERLWAELMDKIREGIQPLLDLLDQEAEQEFAAQLNLEAHLQFGALVNKVYKRKPKPEPVDDEDDEDDEEPKKKPKKKPREPKGGIEIKIKPSKDLEGRIMNVAIHIGDKVMVLYDPDSDLMKEAKQSKPLNRLLMRSIIADEFTSAIIRQNLVVASGLYSAEAWEQLKEDLEGDRLLMASFVKPRLFKVIGEINKKEDVA